MVLQLRNNETGLKLSINKVLLGSNKVQVICTFFLDKKIVK